MKRLLLLLMFVGLTAAITEFRSGETINIRTPFLYYGVPTAGASCLLDLYSPTTQLISNAAMTDNANGWYNLTLIAPAGQENRTNYAGLVKCTYNGENGSTAFDFSVVREVQDEWSYGLNNTASQSNEYLKSINQSVSQAQNTSQQQLNQLESINNSLNNLQNNSGSQLNFMSELFRVASLISQKMSSLLEYNMKDRAHYHSLASKETENCSFNPSSIVMEKYTISPSFDPTGDLEDGYYCFTMTQYDSYTDSYGLYSNPVRLYVNNSLRRYLNV